MKNKIVTLVRITEGLLWFGLSVAMIMLGTWIGSVVYMYIQSMFNDKF